MIAFEDVGPTDVEFACGPWGKFGIGGRGRVRGEKFGGLVGEEGPY